MLVSLTLLLLSFPPLRNRRSVKRIKISRNRDKTRGRKKDPLCVTKKSPTKTSGDRSTKITEKNIQRKCSLLFLHRCEASDKTTVPNKEMNILIRAVEYSLGSSFPS